MQKKLKAAIAAGLQYLRGEQTSDGAFIDFTTTGAPSVEWMTAHTCWILENIPNFRSRCKKGAQYLAGNINTDGTWGFNKTLSGDCSSTSQALMVLQNHSLPIPQKAIQWILNQQNPEGGFPTYPFKANSPFNNWSIPHADTTLEVIGALKRMGLARTKMSRALQWMNHTTKHRYLEAFWWEHPGYILWLQKKLSYNSNACIPLCRNILLNNALSIPNLPFLLYQLGAASHPDALIHEAVESILGIQQSDGSWLCQPCLKVTSFQKLPDFRQKTSPLYSGDKRIFSTAHTIACLYDFLHSEIAFDIF